MEEREAEKEIEVREKRSRRYRLINCARNRPLKCPSKILGGVGIAINIFTKENMKFVSPTMFPLFVAYG